jgi:hypothetical protein
MVPVEKPDVFPGPHGRAMHVVTAIVKRDKKGPALTRPTPYGRRKLESGMIARCGNAPRGCRGVLGYPVDGYLASKEFWLPRSLEHSLGAWCITHPDKYRGDAETGYVVLDPRKGRRAKNGEKIGAHAVPARLRISDAQAGDGMPGPRRIVGQIPDPPCIIFCPTCGTPNWVEAPDGSPPPRRYRGVRL